MMHYALYGAPLEHIGHDDLITRNRETGDYLARAEQSGCEGYYTEVARGNHGRGRWERFCFAKFLGGEDAARPDWHPEKLAEHYTREVNDAAKPGQSWLPLIHHLPDFGRDKP